MKKICNNKCIKEFGDYQTPYHFALKVCLYLRNDLKYNPDYVVEPTFGKGSFIEASLNIFPELNGIYGVELQKEYYLQFNLNKNVSNTKNIYLYNDNIFTHKLDNKFKSNIRNNKILIIGNPPWVNNSTLGELSSNNLPQKSNFKHNKGLEAITGTSNFDISEYIVMHILKMFYKYQGYIAMLLKSSVARKIVYDYEKYQNLPLLSDIKILDFDGKSVFNINCKTSLFVAKFGYEQNIQNAGVYNFDTLKLQNNLGWVNGKFTYNIKKYEVSKTIDGISPLIWRQGVKHDCTKIVVIDPIKSSKLYRNGFKEEVLIENDFVYDLIKSSDLKNFETKSARKKIIITQRKINEDTTKLRKLSPLLWDYLIKNRNHFDRRKSKIYKNSPLFSIFGIGDYSFKTYKVAISGFYKKPHFSLVHPIQNKPVMLDDTCYFIGFDDYKNALITTALFNSKPVLDFLYSQAFLDSKRPYTKKLLMRIDITKLAKKMSYNNLLDIFSYNNINYTITENDFKKYINF